MVPIISHKCKDCIANVRLYYTIKAMRAILCYKDREKVQAPLCIHGAYNCIMARVEIMVAVRILLQ